MTEMLFLERHEYTAGNGFDGWCQIRIYAPTEASGGLPVVIVSEPDAPDSGPSVTNTAEQLAAEIGTRYLGAQDGVEPPFVFVEHYGDRQVRGRAARFHDPFFGEDFDLVTFATWKRTRRWVMGRERTHFYETVGQPEWQHVDRAHIEELIGEPLPWPACTCNVAPL
jgi:hypothetical protein